MSTLTTAPRSDLAGLGDAELSALLRESGRKAGPAVQGVMGEVFARHHKAVLGYARTCCRDAATAHDLAAEAFARTYQAVASGGGPQHAWRPYLLTCVRHIAVEWARDGARTRLSDDFESWADSLPAGQDVEGAVLAAEEGSLVLRAFRSLPERWQAVLWHAVVEREPAAATARRLDMTARGVGSLAARAREGLREAYLRAHLDQAASEECRHFGGRLAGAIRRPDRRADRDLARHLQDCADCARADRDLRDLNGRLGALLPAGLLLWSPHVLWPAVSGHGAQLAGAKLIATKLGAARLGTAKAVWTAAVVAGATVSVVALLPSPDRTPDRGAPAPADVPAAASASAGPEAATPEPSGPSLVPAVSGTASPTAAPLPPGSRTLVNRMTGLCAQADPGGALAVRACDGGAAQAWQPVTVGTGLQFRNIGTGRCLSSGGSTADQAPLVQEDCSRGRQAQLWTTCPEFDGLLMNAASHLYLGVKHWPKADHVGAGDQVTQSQNYYGSPAFRWQQRPVGAS
ncbi:sigma-70 family RNA polymerase sigma factor [Kitasatospora camelliae]|uniref:Sigma-70 family RNA polymerase sigma factor n=1 Tax=Kitasatospora camelliae TaxID=3156397 RepID=A0AAU8K657_9ACTN